MTDQSLQTEREIVRLYNEPLSRYTTFRIGGPAEVFSIPPSEEQLIAEIDHCRGQGIPWRILGNGSNLLVRDRKLKGYTIYNKHACSGMRVVDQDGDSSIVEAGSSVMLPKLVRFCVDHSLEGMEFLHSVPGTVGGGLFMNAGRGRIYNQSIADKVESVRVYTGHEIVEMGVEECRFDFRRSVFAGHRDWVILGARFRLKAQDRDVGKKLIAERMQFVKGTQERQYPNAGTAFRVCSRGILRRLRGFKYGEAELRDNWISNLGQASAHDVLMVMRTVMLLHYVTLRKVELEIEVW